MNTSPETTPCKAANAKPAKQISMVDTPDIDAKLRAATQAEVEAMQKPFSKGSAAKPSPYGS